MSIELSDFSTQLSNLKKPYSEFRTKYESDYSPIVGIEDDNQDISNIKVGTKNAVIIKDNKGALLKAYREAGTLGRLWLRIKNPGISDYNRYQYSKEMLSLMEKSISEENIADIQSLHSTALNKTGSFFGNSFQNDLNKNKMLVDELISSFNEEQAEVEKLEEEEQKREIEMQQEKQKAKEKNFNLAKKLGKGVLDKESEEKRLAQEQQKKKVEAAQQEREIEARKIAEEIAAEKKRQEAEEQEKARVEAEKQRQTEKQEKAEKIAEEHERLQKEAEAKKVEEEKARLAEAKKLAEELEKRQETKTKRKMRKKEKAQVKKEQRTKKADELAKEQEGIKAANLARKEEKLETKRLEYEERHKREVVERQREKDEDKKIAEEIAAEKERQEAEEQEKVRVEAEKQRQAEETKALNSEISDLEREIANAKEEYEKLKKINQETKELHDELKIKFDGLDETKKVIEEKLKTQKSIIEVEEKNVEQIFNLLINPIFSRIDEGIKTFSSNINNKSLTSNLNYSVTEIKKNYRSNLKSLTERLAKDTNEKVQKIVKTYEIFISKFKIIQKSNYSPSIVLNLNPKAYTSYLQPAIAERSIPLKNELKKFINEKQLNKDDIFIKLDRQETFTLQRAELGERHRKARTSRVNLTKKSEELIRLNEALATIENNRREIFQSNKELKENINSIINRLGNLDDEIDDVEHRFKVAESIANWMIKLNASSYEMIINYIESFYLHNLGTISKDEGLEKMIYELITNVRKDLLDRYINANNLNQKTFYPIIDKLDQLKYTLRPIDSEIFERLGILWLYVGFYFTATEVTILKSIYQKGIQSSAKVINSIHNLPLNPTEKALLKSDYTLENVSALKWVDKATQAETNAKNKKGEFAATIITLITNLGITAKEKYTPQKDAKLIKIKASIDKKTNKISNPEASHKQKNIKNAQTMSNMGIHSGSSSTTAVNNKSLGYKNKKPG